MAISIGIGVRSGDLAQAGVGFQRLGQSATDAGERVNRLATAAKDGNGKVEAAALAAAASMGRLGSAVQDNTGRAGKALEAAAYKVELLRQEIAATQAAGGPVSPDAVATLRAAEDALEDNTRKLAQYRNVQDDVKDSVAKARSESDLQRGSINDLGDLVERMGPKWADMVGKVSAGIGTFGAAYAGTRKLIEGLRELTGIDVDAWVQGHLKGFAEWVTGADEDVGAADRLRNAQKLLRSQGIDPTGKSLEELDRLLEQNARKHGEAVFEAEKHADARKRAAKEAAEAEADAWRRATEAAEEAIARQKQARAEAAEWARSYVATLTPAGAAVDRFRQQLAKLEEASLGGVDPTLFRQTLEAMQEELAASLEKARKTVNEKPIAVTVAAHVDGSAIRDAIVKSAELRDKWIGFAGALEDGYGIVDRGAAEAVAGIGMVIEGLVRARAAGDDFAKSAAGWATVAAGISSIAAATGLLSQNMTSGGFGGRGEGNYASEGSSIGAVIGAAIGAYYGGAAGAQAGMAIGSAAGGLLGSFIQKGAEEALAVSVDSINGVALLVTKSEGGLGRVISQIGYTVNEALNGVMDLLGGSIEDLPAVSAKVRDGLITMVVGGVKARFKEVDDAVAFTITELLKQGQFSGMSDTIRQVLSRTNAPDLASLTKDLEFGRWYERLGLAEAGQEFLDALGAYRNRLREAASFGLDTGPVTEQFGRDLAEIRNNILGIQETEEERIRRQSAAYNAQASLVIAEGQLDLFDLEQRKAALEAKVEVLRAEAGLSDADVRLVQGQAEIRRAGVEAGASWLTAEYQLLDAEFQLYDARLDMEKGAINALAETLVALAGVTEQIEALRGMLDQISLISPDDIAGAISHIPSPGSIGSYGGGGGGPSPEDAEAERQRRIAAAQKEARELLSNVFDAGWSERLRSMVDGNARLRAEYEALNLSLDEVTRAEGARRDLLREEAVGALGLSSDAIRKRYDGIAKALGFLATNAASLALSADEVYRIARELGDELYLGVGRSLAEAIGDQETLAALEQLDWQIRLANWELEIDRLEAMEVLSKEQLDNLRRMLAIAQGLDLPASTTAAGGIPPEQQSAFEAWLQTQEGIAEMQADAARRLREAIDRLIEFQRSLFLDDSLSPLTGVQRLGVAETAAQQAVAAIAAMGPNDTRRADAISSLPDILRAYLEELAGVYGTASGQYAAGFAWVAQVLSGLTGQTVIPFPTGGTGGGNTGSGGGSGLDTGHGGHIVPGPHAAEVLPFTARLGTATNDLTRAPRQGSGADVDAGRLARIEGLLERQARALETIAAQERAEANAARRRFAGVAS